MKDLIFSSFQQAEDHRDIWRARTGRVETRRSAHFGQPQRYGVELDNDLAIQDAIRIQVDPLAIAFDQDHAQGERARLRMRAPWSVRRYSA